MLHFTTTALTAALSLASLAQGYVIQVDTSNGDNKHYYIRDSNLTAEEFLANRDPVTYRSDHDERDAPCQTTVQYYSYGYQLIGDGNPHQNYKIGQIAGTYTGCTQGAQVSTGHEQTFEWSIGGGFNTGGLKYDFADLGFTVGESDTRTVQQTFACGGNGMTAICALSYTAVTALTVEFTRTSHYCAGLTGEVTSQGTGVVYLPNANGQGSITGRGASFTDERNIFQCLSGGDGREVDFFCGPAGGPEWWDAHREAGPWAADYMNSLDPEGCAIPIEAYKFDD